MTITTKSGKVATIRVRNVGVNFGCVGQIVARNGRVLGESQTRPSRCRCCRQQASRAAH
jgi:hypothetical protein